jgi:hypothetical protein
LIGDIDFGDNDSDDDYKGGYHDSDSEMEDDQLHDISDRNVSEGISQDLSGMPSHNNRNVPPI